MNQINKIKIFNFREFLLLLSVTSFIVLFDFNLRWLIFLYSPYVFLKIIEDIKYRNLEKLYISILLILFLFFHLNLNSYIYDFSVSNKQLVSILVVGYIYFLSCYFYREINKNKKKLIYIFFILFIISSLVGIFNYHPDNPKFCGGLKNIFFSIDFINKVGSDYFYKGKALPSEVIETFDKINLSFKEYLFKENSHLGMIAPSFILIFLYYSGVEKTSLFKYLIFFIFIIFCFIKSSATLLIGLILSSLTILIFQYKKINKSFVISNIILILFVITIFLNDKECKKRIFYEDIKKVETSEPSTLYVDSKLNKKFTWYFLKNKLNISSDNITAKVFYYKLKLTTHSIFENPLGWGLQNYQYAQNYLSDRDLKTNRNLNNILTEINSNDGSNNLNKIIVEFGLLGILLYLFLFFYLINPRINVDEKIFLLPFVITQSIRGAGYFNAGFILIIFLIFMSYIYRKDNN